MSRRPRRRLRGNDHPLILVLAIFAFRSLHPAVVFGFVVLGSFLHPRRYPIIGIYYGVSREGDHRASCRLFDAPRRSSRGPGTDVHERHVDLWAAMVLVPLSSGPYTPSRVRGHCYVLPVEEWLHYACTSHYRTGTSSTSAAITSITNRGMVPPGMIAASGRGLGSGTDSVTADVPGPGSWRCQASAPSRSESDRSLPRVLTLAESNAP